MICIYPCINRYLSPASYNKNLINWRSKFYQNHTLNFNGRIKLTQQLTVDVRTKPTIAYLQKGGGINTMSRIVPWYDCSLSYDDYNRK